MSTENTQGDERSGSCLCGSVKVSAKPATNRVGVCHCGMCRKRVGGPFFALDCGSEVKFSGEENISVYGSSEWAERGFCKKCGSNLFYRLKQNQQYIMSAGLFEGIFEFDHQIFIDEKPSYYEFSNKTHNMTGAEVFAKYSQ
jgi:hypothetical protein